MKRNVAVATLMFGLAAVMTGLVCELADRQFPLWLGASRGVSLDFEHASVDGPQALNELAAASRDFDLGLVRVAPELDGDKPGDVLVALEEPTQLPPTIPRFGRQSEARSADTSYLEDSPPDGRYLILGSGADVGGFTDWLEDRGIAQTWSELSPMNTVRTVVTQPAFRAALTAIALLMVVASLGWYCSRARGRALRVLGGAPALRVHFEDVSLLAWATAGGGVVAVVMAAGVVTLTQGPGFVLPYLRILAPLAALLLLAALVVACAASLIARPRPDLVGRRIPATLPLGRPAAVVMVAALAVTLFSVAPSWSTLQAQRDTARTLGQWELLSEQTALVFGPNVSETDFDDMKPSIRALTLDAQLDGVAALSMLQSAEYLDRNEINHDGFDGVAVVNPLWLGMIGLDPADPDSGLRVVDRAEMPGPLSDSLAADLEVWMDQAPAGAGLPEGMRLLAPTGDQALPMIEMGSGGTVAFVSHPLLVVVEDLDVFTSGFLISTASSANLTVVGLERTRELIRAAGISGIVRPERLAEGGVMAARYSAAFAWVQGAALVALIAGLVAAQIVNARVVATRNARRDYPMRLDGASWLRIRARRLAAETTVCGLVALAAAAVAFRRDQPGFLIVLAVAAAAALAGAAAHLAASENAFKAVSRREL
ncbi:MAG: hypothetical protein LBH68_05125 [Bifidobacteriaceae bacterium]|nr:hypothetical protein [Bifidobacteriaceae bacterium]